VFLSRLASDCDPPDFHLPSSWEYRHELLNPVRTCFEFGYCQPRVGVFSLVEMAGSSACFDSKFLWEQVLDYGLI
jgi:hypothetical protein